MEPWKARMGHLTQSRWVELSPAEKGRTSSDSAAAAYGRAAIDTSSPLAAVALVGLVVAGERTIAVDT